MAYTHADYTQRSQRLAGAAQLLLASLDDTGIDRSLAIADVESATSEAPISDLAKGFEAAAGTTHFTAGPEAPEDVLSGALLEIYSANVLLSSGLAVNEHGGGGNRVFLLESVQQLEASHSPLGFTSYAFEAAAHVQSASVDTARQTFRRNAEGVLGEIVDQAAAVIGEILEQLKTLGAAKALQAIEGLGKAIPVVAEGGRLIRQGLQKLKNVLDALAKLIGPELFAKAKDKVLDVWKKVQAGEYTKAALSALVQKAEVEQRIAAAAARGSVALEEYDGASNEIASLVEHYAGTMKSLRSLLAAVVTTSAILVFVPVALPYLPAAAGGAYAILAAVAIVTAIRYSGSADWVAHERSLADVADALA